MGRREQKGPFTGGRGDGDLERDSLVSPERIARGGRNSLRGGGFRTKESMWVAGVVNLLGRGAHYLLPEEARLGKRVICGRGMAYLERRAKKEGNHPPPLAL